MFSTFLARNAGVVATGLILAGCVTSSAPVESRLLRSDLEVVDCLFPGVVRRLGDSVYTTQRRPGKTTAADCRASGGEYTEYDQADQASALRIWMPAAEFGDAEAQNNVGVLFEQGRGGEPNHEAAAIWYQKAADQGHAGAQFNLGSLYERGLGVPADKLRALNLYRQSWGVAEDDIIYQSAAAEQIAGLRAELEQEIAGKDDNISVLQKQLQEQQVRMAGLRARPSADVSELNRQIEGLQRMIATHETERRSSSSRLALLRTPSAAGTSVTQEQANSMAPAEVRKALGVAFGRYYALVIGNQHYEVLDDLQTPVSDAQRAARVLRDRYGFSVQVLEDANDMTMLQALDDLNRRLKPEDNLLIYYAGHGLRLQAGKREIGYWLPVNAAEPPRTAFWVQNEQITAHLARMSARRVLIVADSCYAGLLSEDPNYRLFGSGKGYTVEAIKTKLPRRSRLLLSSGGDHPVLDAGGGGNSVFARAFLDVLESNTGVLSTPELFARISSRVGESARHTRFPQKPEFKSIRSANHGMGDFFFVPKG
jgi:uncharacterized protein